MKRAILAALILATSLPVAHAQPGGEVGLEIVGEPEYRVAENQSWTVEFDVRNEGNTPIENLQITSRRGDAATSPAALEEYLVTGAFPYYGKQEFLDPLQPGQSRTVTMEVPLDPKDKASLAIADPGTYPLLFTLTGTQEGQPVSLAQTNSVLWVGDKAKPKVSVIYPVVENVNVTPGATGGEPFQLVDDSLAESFADGGRVNTLLDNYFAADIEGCIAVDPALVDAADHMQHGYDVGPKRPPVVEKPRRLRDSWFQNEEEADVVPGKGAHDAAAFLDQLSAADCVVPTTWAQVDARKVKAVGNRWLLREATTRGTDTLSRVLGKNSDYIHGVSDIGEDPALTRLLQRYPAALGTAKGKTVAVVDTPAALKVAGSLPTIPLPSGNTILTTEDFPARERIARQAADIDELMNVMDNDPNIAMSRYGFTAPLRRDLLYAMNGDMDRLAVTDQVVSDLRDSVALIPPGNIVTRISESSPLLVVAKNGLPLPVNATIGHSGTTLSETKSVRIPARGSITVSLTTQMPDGHDRSDLDLWLASPAGVPISEPVRITVQTRAGIVGVSTFIALCGLAVVIALIVRRKRQK